MKEIEAALEAAGFTKKTTDTVGVGDTVFCLAGDDPTSLRAYAATVATAEGGEIEIVTHPGATPMEVPSREVWAKAAEFQPGTYASVTYKGEERVGVHVRGGAWVVVDTEGDPYPTWDSVDSVQVNEVLWEPHAPKATGETTWPTETPTVKLLRENPAWCVRDSDGDYWWAEGEDVMTDSGPWPGRWDEGDEEADKFLRVPGWKWEVRKA